MRIKSTLLLLVCLLLSGLTLPSMACPSPDCGSCCYWISTGPDPNDGYCELIPGADCGDCSGCSPCNSCIACLCVWECSPGATCCNGSCCSNTCCNGVCCSAGQNCCGGSCCSNACCDGTCCTEFESCCGYTCCNIGCQECISPGICVDCYTDYSSECSWTSPPVQSGCPGQTVDDLSCSPLDIGKTCHWETTDNIKLWNDACPCCTLDTTPCVELTPWKCGNKYQITMGWVCHCDEESIGTPVYQGSGTECP